MKTILTTAIIFLCFRNTFAQISTTIVAAEKQKLVSPYDSLNNFLGKDYKKYKGQKLYLIPKDERLREYGYEGFLNDIKNGFTPLENQFKFSNPKQSNYSDLAEKYFYVEEIIEGTNDMINSIAYFKLKFIDTGKYIYFAYNPKYQHSFPFLVLGYYEKQKQIFVNKEVLIRDFPKIEGLEQKKKIDTETGIEIEITKGEYLKCLDITIDLKYFEPALLLINKKKQKFLFPLHARNLQIQRILTKQEAERYRQKFGDLYWQAIINEKVIAGFTEEMTRVSWGEPEKINKSSYGDQWVYENRYLYFKNGILESFN
jgi:hypothetical protein